MVVSFIKIECWEPCLDLTLDVCRREGHGCEFYRD